MAIVTGLFIYPVKSCRGLAVSTAQVDRYGLVGDRRFLIVNADGKFLTQRQQPRLALIETALAGSGLTLAAAGHSSVSIAAHLNSGRRLVTVWNDTTEADDCGDEAANWLSDFMGEKLRLVRLGETYRRPVGAKKITRAGFPPSDEHEVMFSDADPLLLISEESLADLNRRLLEQNEAPVPMNRFRPNVVVRGAAPFAEDNWRRFQINDVIFRGSGPCSRCIVTTTDQLTGERGKEPLRTLATFRRDAAKPSDINFGANLIHESKTGTVSIGAGVKLL